MKYTNGTTRTRFELPPGMTLETPVLVQLLTLIPLKNETYPCGSLCRTMHRKESNTRSTFEQKTIKGRLAGGVTFLLLRAKAMKSRDDDA